jgi:4-amino-4-deoxy-L-arabinose transferase-like glycosyltransferase
MPMSAKATDILQNRSRAAARWWREWELGLLMLLVCGIYGSRLTDLSLRGEESRRGLVALEMVWSGDWLIPRQQGNAAFMSSRPPLQNWAIAACGLLVGRIDALAVRLPSVIGLLTVVTVLYCYARRVLSRFGALAAGTVYVTLLHVMELGRLGETDQMLTAFVCASLLLWHGGLMRGWHPGVIWSSGYFCAALATMTKGVQGTVYFVGPVAVYLVATRQWRFALSRWHALGACLFVTLVGSWLVPFGLEVGLEGLRHTCFGDVQNYTRDFRWWVVAEHLAVYPAEIVLGCLLPWSIFLFVYARRDFRAGLGPARDPVLFLATAVLVTFPTVWFVPTSLTRFYASMYPCIALLIGIAIARCVEAGPQVVYGRLWRQFSTLAAVVMAISAVLVPVLMLFDPSGDQFGQPTWFLVAFALACLPLSYAVWKSREAVPPAPAARGLLSMALFLGLCSTGLYLNHRIVTTPETSASMSRILKRLPPNASLVSLGTVPHLFNLHYGSPIRALPLPAKKADVPADLDYFCYTALWQNHPKLPFAWQEIGTVVCDRYVQPVPENVVVVGRRIRPRDGSPSRGVSKIVTGGERSVVVK